ncbi:prenyltransferase, partial [Dysgonomonas sp. UBA7698]
METKKPTLKNWVIATRPWSFPVSSLPALIAMMYTIHVYPESSANWILGVIAIIGAVVFQAGGNLISDYYDYKYGVDREGKVGTDILTSKLFTPKQVFIYGWAFIA